MPQFAGGAVSKDNALPVAPTGTDYEAVGAGTTATLGGAGAIDDLLNGVLITPLTTSPGAVSIKDGAGNAITIFAGGANSVGSLVPFFAYVGARSLAGGWSVTTGANVTAIGVGDFT